MRRVHQSLSEPASPSPLHEKALVPYSPSTQKESEQLPNANVACLKISGKSIRGLRNNSFFLLSRDDGRLAASFITEHRVDKKYASGSFSRVKKGFVNSGYPAYAIKIYNNKLTEPHKLRVAEWAAYCFRLLGEESFVFRQKNKQYLVTEWYGNSNLYQAWKHGKILMLTIRERIELALQLSKYIAMLHQCELTLTDTKPENVVISFGHRSVRLVDLDSARFVKEKPLLQGSFTLEYCSPEIRKDVRPYCNDEHTYESNLYALGLTLMFLFPDLFYLGKEGNFLQFKERDACKAHKELADLIESLVSEDSSKRPPAKTFVKELQTLCNKQYVQDEYVPEIDMRGAFNRIIEKTQPHDVNIESMSLIRNNLIASVTDPNTQLEALLGLVILCKYNRQLIIQRPDIMAIFQQGLSSSKHGVLKKYIIKEIITFITQIPINLRSDAKNSKLIQDGIESLIQLLVPQQDIGTLKNTLGALLNLSSDIKSLQIMQKSNIIGALNIIFISCNNSEIKGSVNQLLVILCPRSIWARLFQPIPANLGSSSPLASNTRCLR